jgi:hypothetical protein
MRVLALSVAAFLAAAPALADEAIVIPDDNGRTVIHDRGLLHDKTTIIEHRNPDTVVVPEDHDDVTISPDNGASSGEAGVDVDVETHEHIVPPPDDDR